MKTAYRKISFSWAKTKLSGDADYYSRVTKLTLDVYSR